VILAPDGSIYYSNPLFEEMIRKEPSKIACSFLAEHVHEEDRERFELLLGEASRSRAGRGEIRLRAEDGTVLPVYVSLSALHLEEFNGICVTLTDLTEQKMYIARLERSNRELEDFASIASHDLQEPLRKVISFGNILRKNHQDTLGETGSEHLNRMLGATERMQTLLTSLLEYARVTTKQVAYQKVDLYDIVREVLSDLEVKIAGTGGEVQVGRLPVIEADHTQMRQLFQNLIGNGLKFHKDGEKPLVKVRCTEPDSLNFQIIVADNGIGFDEQYSEKIFSPFQRLHGRNSRYEGTGMGLAICMKIVERHGGLIEAKSKPGEGSTFIITLPKRFQNGIS
jgi:PAS domain S-box-containing protein